MTHHILKCWPPFYDAVASGAKTFELRLDDRGFQKGDTLELLRTLDDDWEVVARVRQEDSASAPLHTLTRTVTYCLHGPKFGLTAGWVILALSGG